MVRLLRDPANIPELMAWADLALVAAGGTLWELLCMGYRFSAMPEIQFKRDRLSSTRRGNRSRIVLSAGVKPDAASGWRVGRSSPILKRGERVSDGWHGSALMAVELSACFRFWFLLESRGCDD